VRDPEKHRKRAVRMGTSKAVHLAPSKPIELFDLESDIGAEQNVADQHPKVAARAKRILKRVRTDEKTWPVNEKKDTMPF